MKNTQPSSAIQYSYLSKVLLRAPRHSLERFSCLSEGLVLVPDDMLAILIASESMASAIQREPGSQRKRTKLHNSILRYLVRMSTRSTPFGIFAGSALVEWGESTDISIAAAPARTRTRCDVVGLMSFIWALESIPEIMRELVVVMNSAAYVSGKCLRLSGIEESPSPVSEECVTIKLNSLMKYVVELTQVPIQHSALLSKITSFTGEASPNRTEALLRNLWQFGFLVTDLRPPLSGDDPLTYVIERLDTISVAKQVRQNLIEFQAMLRHWDASPDSQSCTTYKNLCDCARKLTRDDTNAPLQVDSALSIEGGKITRVVADEAVRAAELLLRFTTRPAGLPGLSSYRDAFISRYGVDKAVPLLELLDTEDGLGGPDFDNRKDTETTSRDAYLLSLAINAIRKRMRILELNSDMISKLETYSFSPETAPASIDIYVQVVARSLEEVDRGEFTLVVGPNIGAGGAGKNAGRFFDLLPEIVPFVKDIAEREEILSPSTHIAELVYNPRRLKNGNVIVCPSVRKFQTGVTVSAFSGANEIPLRELYVCIDRGHFALRWRRDGIDCGQVSVVAGHMLNFMGAPPVCRLLDEIMHDGRARLSWFDWGSARKLPFLPRVVSGRVVLRLAQWRIDGSMDLPGLFENDNEEQFERALDVWREEWGVPKYVYVNNERGMPDNRILMNLESPNFRVLLREDIQNLRAGDALILQEALPGPGDSWLRGPKGNYLNELVVSMIRKEPRTVSNRWKIGTQYGAVATSECLFPPGSEWLTVQFYMPSTQQNAFLKTTFYAYMQTLLATGIIREWMFLRYSDPDHHIRLRLHITQDGQFERLFQSICQWCRVLVSERSISRFSFCTYEREVDRYGGLDGVRLAESIFCADSQFVLEALKGLRSEAGTVLFDLAIFSLGEFLNAFDVPVSERENWCLSQGASRRMVSEEYRARQSEFHEIITNWSSKPENMELPEVAALRRETLDHASHLLLQLDGSGQLTRPIPELVKSYIHMHCNRMFGLDRDVERRILSVASCVYRSILGRRNPGHTI